MKRKDILFLTTQLPYPPVSGGTIKSYHLVGHLSKNNNLHLACLLKDDDEENEKDFLGEFRLAGYFSQKLEVKRNIFNYLKSFLLSASFNSYRNRSKIFKKTIGKMADVMDAIVVDHYEMFQYVPKDFVGKVIFHSHNAEFMLWERMSDLESNIFKKAILKAESFRVKKLEKSIIDRSDIIFASPYDISVYKEIGIQSLNYATTYHLGNDDLLEKKAIQFEETEKSLVFVGTLSWEPNVQGLIWFMDEVFPRLKHLQPEAKVYIVGGKIDQRLLDHKNHKDIVFTGFVDDLEGIYQKARISVIPLRFGSGMKVKVLESMYRGIPMVSTSIGVEGIELMDGENVFVEDEAVNFADKISLLMDNKGIWTKFRDNSREIAKEKYTWEMLFDHMDQVMDKVLG